MKKIITVLLTLVAMSGVVSAESLRIGTEGAYAPFNMIDKDGKLIGFDVEIAKALCKKMGADCKLVTQDWDGIIPGLMARKYDAIVASMSITDERKKAVDFTDHYYSNVLRVIAKKGSNIDTKNLKGKTLGAQRATIAAQHAEKMGKTNLYDTQENAYLDLASGRIDALVTDMLPGYEWLHSKNGSGYEFVGDTIDINDKIGIAVRKGDDKLRNKFNAALKEIIKDGTYKRINATYFPFSIY